MIQEHLRKLLSSSLDSDSLFTHAIAQVVQLSATHLATAHYLNLSDTRSMQREGTLNAFAVGNLADGKRLVHAGTTLADHDTLKYLYALFAAFDHAAVYLHSVAHVEGRHIVLELLLSDFIENVHLLLGW